MEAEARRRKSKVQRLRRALARDGLELRVTRDGPHGWTKAFVRLRGETSWKETPLTDLMRDNNIEPD